MIEVTKLCERDGYEVFFGEDKFFYRPSGTPKQVTGRQKLTETNHGLMSGLCLTSVARLIQEAV